jgi:alpha-galactosidase
MHVDAIAESATVGIVAFRSAKGRYLTQRMTALLRGPRGPMLVLGFTLLLTDVAAPPAAEPPKPLKVFILAGQSNMEGQGIIAADPRRNDGKGSLEYLVKNPATAERYKHLIDAAGKWGVREDVWISYWDRHGPLTAGYGAREDRIGPELGFGHVVGEAFDTQVLLIKCAWGGKSLAKDFRPPSSGGEVGPYYTQVVQRSKDVLARLNDLFPASGGRGYELAGFGWHQGWNDRINQAFNDEYEKNMANFIRDIRKDLGAAKLPFVIAETGMNGPEESHPRALSLMKAQAAVAAYPEFQGNVAFVGTKAFWRPQDQSPSGQGYHWNTNAETYYLIGDAMGRAMLSMLAGQEQRR